MTICSRSGGNSFIGLRLPARCGFNRHKFGQVGVGPDDPDGSDLPGLTTWPAQVRGDHVLLTVRRRLTGVSFLVHVLLHNILRETLPVLLVVSHLREECGLVFPRLVCWAQSIIAQLASVNSCRIRIGQPRRHDISIPPAPRKIVRPICEDALAVLAPTGALVSTQ